MFIILVLYILALSLNYSLFRSFVEKTTSNKGNRNKNSVQGFPGGAVVENLPANARDTGSCPGLGRSHMPRSN